MRISVVAMILAAGAALLLADTAAAASDYIRCGGHIIEAGRRASPGKYEVLKKCGEPVERFGNTWIYDQKNSRRILRFNDTGQLAAIESRRR